MDDPADLPAGISRAALERRCAKCVEALHLFIAAYGAEAGNLALRSVATAGVYVGGGIAPKILPGLTDGTFLDAFRAKEPDGRPRGDDPGRRHPESRSGPASAQPSTDNFSQFLPEIGFSVPPASC